MARNPWDEFQAVGEAPRAFERTGATTTAPAAPAQAQPPADDFSQFQELQDVDRTTPLSAYAAGDPQLPDAQLDPTGAQEFARPEDMAFASMAQKLVDTPGTTRADFDALSERYGYPRYGDDLDAALAARDSSGNPFRVSVPLGGRRDPIPVLSDIANSSPGAALGAALDTGGLGLSDEIAGLAGGDTLAQVAMGDGEAQRRAQLLKDARAEQFPAETMIGSLAGGITGAAGAGKIAGAGKQIAADIGYGAAYGAGSENENRLGGAVLGGAAAGTGSYFGGKLLDKIANRAPSVAAKAVEKAQGYGIDLPLEAMGRGKAIVGNTLSNMPGSAQVMQGSRDVLSDQVSNAVEDVAGSFGPTTSFTGMGEALQSGAKKWIDKFERTAGKVYDAIPIDPDAKVSLVNTRRGLDEITQGFKSNPELSKIWTGHPRLRETLKALTPTDTREAGKMRLTMEAERLRGADVELNAAREEAVAGLHFDRQAANSELQAATRKFDEAVDGARQQFEAAQARYDAVRNQVPSSPGQFAALRDGADAARQRYLAFRYKDASDPAVASILAPVTKAQRTLDELNSADASTPRLAAATEAAGKAKAARDEAYVEANQPPMGGEVSWQDMKRLRSIVGEIVGDPGLAAEGNAKAALRKFYGIMSEDMKASAAAQGPAALKAFERANTLYNQGQQRIDDALSKILGSDGKKSTEAAAAKVQAMAKEGRSSSDLGLLASIRKSLPTEEWGQVQNALVRLAGQPLNKSGRDFDPGVFARTFKDMDPAAKNLIFGKGELRQNLDEFTGVLESLGKVSALRNTSNTAGQVLTGLGFSTIGGVPALAGQMATTYSLAKLWTNPRFVKWASGYTRMAKAAAASGGQPNVGKQMELLKKVAVAEPVIAQDVLGLQRYLAQQFSGSPGKLAADDNSQPIESAP